MHRPLLRVIGILLLLLSAAPGVAIAQASTPQTPPQTSSPATPTATLDGQKAEAQRTAQADLDRIKDGLTKLPPVRFDQQGVTFHTNSYAPANHTFEDIVGSFDLMKGAVPNAGPTHQDMMDYWQTKNFTASQHVTVNQAVAAAFIDIGVQELRKLIQKNIDELHTAKNEDDVKRLRAQIDRELAELAAKQKDGGGH